MKQNPLSSAKGLIQFMDTTAKAMGYQNSYDLIIQNPTVEKQLMGPVLKYFKQFAPFHTEQDFYLSVFLPKYRHAAQDTVIYDDHPGMKEIFQKQNPGIVTVGDYVNKLKAKFVRSGVHVTPGGAGLASVALLLLSAAAFFF